VIKKILRTIRQKPRAVREQYAFWIACSVTSIVAVCWLLIKLDQFDVPAVAEDVTVDTPNNTLSDFLTDTTNQFSNLTSEVENLSPTNQPAGASSTASVQPDSQSVLVSTTTAAVRQEVRIATTSPSSTVDQATDEQ